jgi:ribose transport system permease protein
MDNKESLEFKLPQVIGKKNKLNIKNILRTYFGFFALLFIIVVFSIWNPKFFSIANMIIIAKQSSVLVVAAFGAMFVIITGSIDLSVGSLVGLSAVVSALISLRLGVIAGLTGGIIVGLLVGLFNGVIVAKGKIPSFIATLGFLTAGRGIILILTQGRPIIVDSVVHKFIGGGEISKIPFIVIVAIIFFIITVYLLNYTVFGRNIYAVGGSEKVARFAGINIDNVKLWAFAIAGVYAGVAGVLLAGRMGAGSPTSGQGLELDVITAVVIGGTLLSGGSGKVYGTVIGALLMSALSNGLNITAVNPYIQYIIKGMVLIVAVLVTLDRRKLDVIK